MYLSDDTLAQIITETEVITKDKLIEAIEKATKDEIVLAEAIIRLGLLSDEQIGKLTADKIGVPFVKLSGQEISDEVLTIIPEIVARKQHAIAFKKDSKGLHVALVEPKTNKLGELLVKKEGVPVIVYLATKKDVEDTLRFYSKDVQKTFEDIISENVKQAKNGSEKDPPIITIVDTIIEYASRNKASDVHIEPEEKSCLVRFRIDGILHDILTLPLVLHPQIVTRIKVMAKLRTDEHASAQDGKLEWSSADKSLVSLDIRASIVPITRGEKVVLRLLSER